jgi:hypothetical protein
MSGRVLQEERRKKGKTEERRGKETTGKIKKEIKKERKAGAIRLA